MSSEETTFAFACKLTVEITQDLYCLFSITIPWVPEVFLARFSVSFLAACVADLTSDQNVKCKKM